MNITKPSQEVDMKLTNFRMLKSKIIEMKQMTSTGTNIWKPKLIDYELYFPGSFGDIEAWIMQPCSTYIILEGLQYTHTLYAFSFEETRVCGKQDMACLLTFVEIHLFVIVW